jgi:hypothetical protein
MACELAAWIQMLAAPGPAREPNQLRLRLFSASVG